MAESAKIRLLKGSVFIMGALIVLLAAVLVGELLRRTFFAETPTPLAAVPLLRAVEPGLPAQARIADLVATRHYVVIHAVLPDGQARLYVLDPAADTSDLARPQPVQPDEEAERPLAR